MDFDKLYLMFERGIPGALCANYDAKYNDIVEALFRGEEHPSKPLAFFGFMGRRPRDVVGTGDCLDLISDRVVDVLRSARFTGWATFPVELYGRNKRRIDGYHGLAVTGRCGAIQWHWAREVQQPPRVPAGDPYTAWIGMYFEPDTWDGSHIFTPEGTTYTIIFEEVKNALERAKVKNFRFERLTEFERTWPK